MFSDAEMATLFEIPDWYGLLAAFVWGALWGSFLNVVIHRLPLGASIVRPGSHCPGCGHPVRAWDNIPILSWLILRGRCRDCRTAISPRYPLVELLTALLSMALYARFVVYGVAEAPWAANAAAYLVYFAFSAALIAVIFIDLDHQIIPNEITFGGIVVGLLVSLLLPDVAWWESLLGVLLGGGFILLIIFGYSWLRGIQGMGMGDVKLLAMVGAFLGYRSLLFVLLVGSVLGLVASLVLGLVRRLTGRSHHLYDPSSLQEDELPPLENPAGQPLAVCAVAGQESAAARVQRSGDERVDADDAGAEPEAGGGATAAVHGAGGSSLEPEAAVADAGQASPEAAGVPDAAGAAEGAPGAPPPAVPASADMPLHRTAIAFGPYLAIAAITYLLVGDSLIEGYQELVGRLVMLAAGG